LSQKWYSMSGVGLLVIHVRRSRGILLAASLFVVVCAVLGGGVPAQAASITTPSGHDALNLVLNSKDPGRAFTSLDPQARAKVRLAVTRLTPTLVATRGGAVDASQSSLRAAGSAAVMTTASGCWYRYWYYAWGNLGIVMAHTWMTLTWCGSGGVITSYVLGATGGASSFPTISYRGIVDKGGLNVRWEVRQYVEFRFSAGWGITFDTTPCQQIRGGATGLVSQRDTCDLS
jgi:hypothetical protein